MIYVIWILTNIYLSIRFEIHVEDVIYWVVQIFFLLIVISGWINNAN